MSETEAPTRKPVSEEEAKIAFSGPASAANRFFIHLSPAGVRIAFAEQGSDRVGTFFRSAVIMPFEDAIGLQKVLAEMMEPVERQLKTPPSGADVERPE